MEARLSPEADDYLRELEADPSKDDLVEAIYDSVDRLIDDPGSAWARRRRFNVYPQNVPMWEVPIPNRDHGHDPHTLLWDWVDDSRSEILIAYIGPETFLPGK